MVSLKNIVMINSIKFEDVTNQTVSRITYNYEEALALTNLRRISTGEYSREKPKEKKETSWKSDSKPWKNRNNY